MKIADIPFVERPVRELLNLVEFREAPQHDYAGFGWARVPRLLLVEERQLDAVERRTHEPSGETRTAPTSADPHRVVEDVLLLAIHTADDAPNIPGDLQLEFELEPQPVAVLASKFLSVWMPKLPPAKTIVLCVCNPHDARIAKPTDATLWLPDGDVHSWRDFDTDEILLTANKWSAL